MKINLIKKQKDMSDIQKDLFLEEEKALIDAFELEELVKNVMRWAGLESALLALQQGLMLEVLTMGR